MATGNDRQPAEMSEPYMVLTIGGIVGAALCVVPLALSWYWWEPFINWLRDGTTESLWQPLTAFASVLVGMAVMFGAFQVARKVEQRDAFLRRILYGYNAVLTTFLLLMVVLMVNVFVQIRYPLPYDTTESQFYSISDATKKFMAELERKISVYLVLTPAEPAYENMRALLTQMQTLNPKYFEFEEVDKNARVMELSKKFGPIKRAGVLVAYGDNPEKNNTFIGDSDLTNFKFGQDGREQGREFNGEVRLLQELYFLAEEKRKPVIYFTQGHGEPDLTDRREDGMAELAGKLRSANYEVRPLTASDPDAEKVRVPDDADLVAVVGPQRPMADIMPALRKYMKPTEAGKKKGKLLVLLGPTPAVKDANNAMRTVGIEDLLSEFNVEATKEQLFMALMPVGGQVVQNEQPEWVAVFATPEAAESRHPLAQFLKDEPLRFPQVRHVKPKEAAGPSGMKAEVVVSTYGLTWLENDMSVSWQATMRSLRDREEFARRIKQASLPVAVAVSEGEPDPHAGMGMRPMGKAATPRVLVIGCSAIATNPYHGRQGSVVFDVLRGSIDWCRERVTSVAVQPKSHQYYQMSGTTSFWNLFWLPLAAMLLGVVGVGIVMWNVRRS